MQAGGSEPVDEMSDADLVVLARSGDADAFRVLVSRYRAMAMSVALHLSGDWQAAEDLVQEASLAAFVSLGRLRDPGRFRNWFYGTVLNVTRVWRRRQAARPVSLDDWDTIRLIADPADEAAQQELRWIVTGALRCLPGSSRTVLVLFYYDGLTVREIAARLGVTTATVKSRLHKGRRQLGRLLAADYPELTRAAGRGERTRAMTELHITKVVTFPARVLAVLADEPGRRVLPAWLSPLEGLPLASPSGAEPAPPGWVQLPSPELAAKVLTAAGGAVRAVRIGELEHGLLFGTMIISGPAGDSEVPAGLGDALGLARLQDCPILASEDILARHGVTVPPGEQAEDLLIRRAGLPAQARNDSSGRTAAPQNMRFTQGLEHWSLRGSFLLDASGGHWQDYSCGTGPGPDPATASGYLRAQVPDPAGFADLRQGILADAYRGRRVRLSADLKTADTAQQAGLYLRVIDPARSRPPETREQLSLRGTTDWTRQHIEADVPADSAYVLFGITLTGPGQIWATNIQVQPS
jgi:RNA polymerase sigma-70 factor (ECF subfamily)